MLGGDESESVVDGTEKQNQGDSSGVKSQNISDHRNEIKSRSTV